MSVHVEEDALARLRSRSRAPRPEISEPLSGPQVAELADAYLSALERQEKSPKTIRAYSQGILDLIGFLEAEPGRRLIRQQLAEWQDHMRVRPAVRAGGRVADESGLSPRTRRQYVSAIRNLLRWASAEEWPGVPSTLYLALPSVRTPRLAPRPLDEDDLVRVIGYLARPTQSPVHKRDRALFFYLLSTGARISEVLQMSRDQAQRAVIVRQKGGSEKMLLAPPVAMDALEEYLASRTDDEPHLWITYRTGGGPMAETRYRFGASSSPLTDAGAREIWRKLATRLGIKPFTTHQIRHSTATVLLDEDVPVEVVAEHLGHAGLSTIQGYGKVRPKRRERAVRAMQEVLEVGERPAPDNIVRLRVVR